MLTMLTMVNCDEALNAISVMLLFLRSVLVRDASWCFILHFLFLAEESRGIFVLLFERPKWAILGTSQRQGQVRIFL